MRADYSKLLFALSFLLLSIFATYCPILSLFSCVKAAERREALCAEGQYFDSGPGKCRTCDIPCKTSEQVCRDLGCFDYYTKSKKELCKPDEYYEKTLEKCRPCSIPCSMSAEQCQQMGCTISSSLPTSDLPPTTTPPDNRGPSILAKTTSAPKSSDSTRPPMWMAIVFSTIAGLVVAAVTAIALYCGKRVLDLLVDKYKDIDRKDRTSCQKKVLSILKIFCPRTYKKIDPEVNRDIKLKKRSTEVESSLQGPGDSKVRNQSSNKEDDSLMKNLDVPFADEDAGDQGHGEQDPLLASNNIPADMVNAETRADNNRGDQPEANKDGDHPSGNVDGDHSAANAGGGQRPATNSEKDQPDGDQLGSNVSRHRSADADKRKRSVVNAERQPGAEGDGEQGAAHRVGDQPVSNDDLKHSVDSKEMNQLGNIVGGHNFANIHVQVNHGDFVIKTLEPFPCNDNKQAGAQVTQ